jgi:pimeloyl-ACP methyl ester carboxylesterase
VTGSGPLDVVLAPGTVSHLDLWWESPGTRRDIEVWSSLARLVRFDKRGTGLSDRPTDVATLEERSADFRAVMDAVGLERAVIFGRSEGGQMACMFAATYPERTTALATCGSGARNGRRDPESPLRGVSRKHAFRRAEPRPDGRHRAGVRHGHTRAIRCAQSIQDQARELGLELRGGVHTGEVEVDAEAVRGIAVHIAARVCASADGSEVLVPSTVRDLTAGASVEYEDRGVHELKGVPEARHLFAVR